MAALFSFKNPWIKRIGLAVAILPIFWIFTRLDIHSMITMLPKVAWWTGPVLLSIVLVSMTMQGVRWWILVKAFFPELTLARALSYHFIGVLFGTALPTSAAQDIIKTVLLSSKNDPSASWAAIWLTRILSLPALGIISIYGFIAMDKSSLPKGWEYGLILFYASVFVLFVLSFSKKLTRPIRLLTEKFVPVKVTQIISDVRESIYRYRNKRGDVAWALFVTIGTQVFLVFSAVFTLKGITGHFYIWQCFAFIPLIELIAVSFPFSPNGMGIREMLNAAMSVYLGLTKEQLGIYILFQIFFAYSPRLIGLLPIIHGFIKDRRAGKQPPGTA